MTGESSTEKEALVQLSVLLGEGDQLTKRGVPFPLEELLTARELALTTGDHSRLPELIPLAWRILQHWTSEARRYADLANEFFALRQDAVHHALRLAGPEIEWPKLSTLDGGAERGQTSWQASMVTAVGRLSEMRSAILGSCVDEALRLEIRIRDALPAGDARSARSLERLHELILAARYQDCSRAISALEELRNLLHGLEAPVVLVPAPPPAASPPAPAPREPPQGESTLELAPEPRPVPA